MKKITKKRQVYTVRIVRGYYDVNVLADSLEDAVAVMKDQTSWSPDVEKCIGVGLAESKYKGEKPEINYYQK